MNDRIYVLHATNVLGGGTVYLTRLAKLLHSHIHLTVVAPPLPTVQRELAAVGADFVGLSARRSWVLVRWALIRWLWSQRSLIRAEKSSVVLNGRGVAYLAPLVRLICGVSPVIISHTELSIRAGNLKEFLYGMAARFARCIVAVSDSVAMQHYQRWPSLVVESIPNWIEFQPGTTLDATNKFASVTGNVRAAVVSRLAPHKGVEDVVGSCAEDGNIELHIYGDGPKWEYFLNMANVFPWLYLHGYVDDLPQRLPAHSVFISGSYSESFSYSVAEAIHAGLLCVVSDIPAHREMLGKDYPVELFFAPGDMAALCNALKAARDMLSIEAGKAAHVAVSMALARISVRNSPVAAKPRYLAVFSNAVS